jgi:hypothetical protein
MALYCPDCNRKAPQGRHAECHVLAILKAASSTQPRGEVSTGVFALDVFHMTDNAYERTYSVMRRLRAKGHDIRHTSIGSIAHGWYRLMASNS